MSFSKRNYTVVGLYPFVHVRLCRRDLYVVSVFSRIGQKVLADELCTSLFSFGAWHLLFHLLFLMMMVRVGSMRR